MTPCLGCNEITVLQYEEFNEVSCCEHHQWNNFFTKDKLSIHLSGALACNIGWILVNNSFKLPIMNSAWYIIINLHYDLLVLSRGTLSVGMHCSFAHHFQFLDDHFASQIWQKSIILFTSCWVPFRNWGSTPLPSSPTPQFFTQPSTQMHMLLAKSISCLLISLFTNRDKLILGHG